MKSKHINNETFLWSAAVLFLGSMGPTQEVHENPAHAELQDIVFAEFHEGASELNEVIVDVSNPALAIPPDTAENYIGNITVHARTSYKRTTH